MKTRLLGKPSQNQNPLGAPRRTTAWLAAFILLALAPLRLELAAEVLCRETFDADPGWVKGGSGAAWGTMVVANGQALLQFSRMEPVDPDRPGDWIASWAPTNQAWHVRFGPERTLELRTDVLQFNQEDAFAALGVNRGANGYIVGLERNEILLVKYGMPATGFANAFFLWEEVALPTNAPLTLSAAFTQVGQDLQIYLRIMNQTNQTVAWETNVWDTSGYDAVLPNRAVRGILMQPEPFPAPYTGNNMDPYIAISYVNTTTAPTQLVEATVDNVEVRSYEAPVIERAVWVSWPEDTMEDQIVIGADTLAGPWRPWPEPIYKRFGRWSMAVPITASNAQHWIQPQLYFKLVPGTQFIDSFDPAKPPYAGKSDWLPRFANEADATRWSIISTNGVMRVRLLQASADTGGGRLAIFPPGPLVQVRDFWASVDILDLAATHENGLVGIGARGVWDPDTGWPGNSNAYIASVVPNDAGVNRAQLSFFPGAWPPNQSAVFTFKPTTPYRLIFSGIGQRFSVELIDLNTGKPAVDPPLVVTNPTITFSQGAVALYIQAGGAVAPIAFDPTLDNFFVTGTKP